MVPKPRSSTAGNTAPDHGSGDSCFTPMTLHVDIADVTIESRLLMCSQFPACNTHQSLKLPHKKSGAHLSVQVWEPCLLGLLGL